MTGLLMFGALMAATLGQGAASPPATGERSEIQELMEQNKTLTARLQKVDKEAGEIAAAKLAVTGTDIALKRAEAAFKQTQTGLSNEWEAFMIRSRQVKNNGCPWKTEAEDAIRIPCNAALQQIVTLAEELKGKRITAEEFAKALAERRKGVTAATLSVTAKEKINKDDRRLLGAVRDGWLTRYRAFLVRSEAYERLKRMGTVAPICDDTKSLIGAKACLDGLWSEKLR